MSEPTSFTREIQFHDARPPHEIKATIECDLESLLTPVDGDARLAYQAAFRLTSRPYAVRLVFEAATAATNCYTFHVHTDWSTAKPELHEFARKSAPGWFSFWTRNLRPADPPPLDETSPDRYRAAVASSRAEDTRLDSIAALQQAILDGLRRGGRYSVAHKEGGTVITWRDGVFTSADYGESDDVQTFAHEAAFLNFLRRFYNSKATHTALPDVRPELDVWTLILRFMDNR